MGEEEKKPEEKKEESAPKAEKPAEDGKKEEKKSGESKAEEQPPPPPQEIVLKVYMHCEGCARKVRRCLKGFYGVEDVITDCRTSTVVVKGEKADPVKVWERVQRKSHRQVELISPIPKPPPEEPKKPEEKEAPKAEEKQVELPVITVVLRVFMHCEACAQEIKKRIQRMKGVESAEPDLKSSQVSVKGAFEPQKLADYINKRTGKHVEIVKVEPEKKEEEKAKEGKEQKKPEQAEKEAKKDEEGGKDKKEGGDAGGSGGGGGGEPPAKPEAEVQVDDPKLELKRNELYNYYSQYLQFHPPRPVQAAYHDYPPRYGQAAQYDYPPRFGQAPHYDYPPQIFSDENPNACSVM